MGLTITFGEIMARLQTPGHRRFIQLPGSLEISFAGAEANVAASIAYMGGESRFVSALPKHDIAEACVHSLRGVGVDTSKILRTDAGRLGLYFVETGANQRPSRVIYDRADSSIAATPEGDYDWDTLFADGSWLHISGITPALSQAAAEASIAAVKAAKEMGMTVSCDLNFRNKLWQWEPGTDARALAGRCMREMLPFVDVLIANEADNTDVLGIQTAANDLDAGHLGIDAYPDVAAQIVEQFPNIGTVAITLRESISATHNNWGAMLYTVKGETVQFSPMQNGEYQAYEIRNIVDRVGGGDSFAASLIYALQDDELCANALDYAVAASCLAHSLDGDFNFNRRSEVLSLMSGNQSGRVQR